VLRHQEDAHRIVCKQAAPDQRQTRKSSMFRFHRALACAAVVAGLYALPAATQAASPSATIGGSIQFQAVMIPNPSPIKDPTCPFIGMNFGTGNVAPFGPVGFTSTECVSFNLLNITTLHASRGMMVLSTATGDLINGSYNGNFIPSQDGKNYVATAMPFAIVGGTGAYAQARGQGTMNIIQGISTGAGTIAPSGWIAY
jgi:hypothetical protein